MQGLMVSHHFCIPSTFTQSASLSKKPIWLKAIISNSVYASGKTSHKAERQSVVKERG